MLISSLSIQGRAASESSPRAPVVVQQPAARRTLAHRASTRGRLSDAARSRGIPPTVNFRMAGKAADSCVKRELTAALAERGMVNASAAPAPAPPIAEPPIAEPPAPEPHVAESPAVEPPEPTPTAAEDRTADDDAAAAAKQLEEEARAAAEAAAAKAAEEEAANAKAAEDAARAAASKRATEAYIAKLHARAEEDEAARAEAEDDTVEEPLPVAPKSKPQAAHRWDFGNVFCDSVYDHIRDGESVVSVRQLEIFLLVKNGESDERIAQMVADIDVNGDGTIDREEWRRAWDAGVVSALRT